MRSAINKFWSLADSGKSAALDINVKTGEMIVVCTKSIHGVEGNGAAPAVYGDDWCRIMTSKCGKIIRDYA